MPRPSIFDKFPVYATIRTGPMEFPSNVSPAAARVCTNRKLNPGHNQCGTQCVRMIGTRKERMAEGVGFETTPQLLPQQKTRWLYATLLHSGRISQARILFDIPLFPSIAHYQHAPAEGTLLKGILSSPLSFDDSTSFHALPCVLVEVAYHFQGEEPGVQ
jgi:hypothetical protein